MCRWQVVYMGVNTMWVCIRDCVGELFVWLGYEAGREPKGENKREKGNEG